MRAGVILYNPQTKQILLIPRWKNGEEYFVIPGGGAEPGETSVQAAQREIQEELGWTLSEKQLQPAFSFRNDDRLEIYFHTTVNRTSAPRIQGEELLRSHAQNIYQPEWLDIKAIRNLNLRPSGLKHELLDFLNQVDLKN